MTPERWTQVESLFHAVLASGREDREAYLAEACGDDVELRDQVAALLAHDRTDASFIETPAVQVVARRLAHEAGEADIPTLPQGTPDSADTPAGQPLSGGALPAGRLVGHFRIVHSIGVGGMGEVYLAEDLKLTRRVALKLLPSALVPDERARRRFLREARAASSLNHPHIVTIHTIEEVEGMNFIIMEYIDGPSLRERLLHGPLSLAETANLGNQVAEAIGAAHAINIVHRDLKPGNILMTPGGQAKIVDFGLAKAAGTVAVPVPLLPEGSPLDARAEGRPTPTYPASFSFAGSIAGTIPYMSPEQTCGEHLEARSDVFSLGCVLYEAATGQRPFTGDSTAAVFQAIRTTQPRPPSALVPTLPRQFDRIVLKALAKNKDERFATAAELAAALRRLSRLQAWRRVRRRVLPLAAAAAVLFLSLLAWSHWREGNLRWAREQVVLIPELAKSEQFFEAYDRARAVEEYLPDDPILQEWKPFVTETLSVTTEPAGAKVYLRRFQRDASGEFTPREYIGTTPIQNRQIARGEYLLAIEKDGHAPVLRSLSNALDRLENGLWIPGALRTSQLTRTSEGTYQFLADSYAPIEIHLKLLESHALPPRMVPVPGGEYSLVGYGRPTEEAASLDDFFIDRFEVSNRDYQEFVDAGGYANRAYWKYSFVKDGRELSWEEGLELLIDRTGKPGPRGWHEQRYPAGLDDHPVTGVTWYEAAAYAEFRGQALPTVFQWEKAARDGQQTRFWGSVMPWGMTGLNPRLEDRANFYGRHAVPVESYEFGASPYGCFHMAGNVAEWCLNARSDGFTTTGGSYHEGPNLFASYGQFPGFYSSPTLGFRCALNLPGASGDQGTMALEDADEVPQLEPVTESEYRLMKAHYSYDPKPLDARIIEDVETADWQRLRISYRGAAGQRSDGPIPEHQRAQAYLWLPHHAARPLQVVNYKPGGASYHGLTAPQETEVVCKPFLDSGRAVFVAVIEGMTDRPLPVNWREPDADTVAYRDVMVHDTLDQRRGLDYLATRDDIDMGKIVCMGLSMGGHDLITMAVEDRFRGTILLAAGLGTFAKQRNMIAEASPANFAPYIPGPKLMIQGRYDESIPFKTSAEPTFKLLSEPKKLIVLETGHFPPMDQWVPPALEWLDQTLGPVSLASFEK